MDSPLDGPPDSPLDGPVDGPLDSRLDGHPDGDPAEVRAATVVPLPAAEAWALVTDVRHHARWVPLTRIEVAPPGDVAPRPGARFTAVSGPGARRGLPGLVDRMVVTDVAPGRAVRYRKLGPVLRGSATVAVRALGPRRSEVVWAERIGLRGVPAALTDPLARPLTAAMLRVALGRLRREVPARAADGRATG